MRSVFQAFFLSALSHGVFGEFPGAKATLLPASPSRASLAFRCMSLIRQLWPLCWRVLLLVGGIWYAELHFVADRIYSRGANEMVLSDLEKAASLFPLDHYYRLGPAQLIIRDNVWYMPDVSLRVLRQVQKNDPHSAYVNSWIGVLQQRQAMMAGVH